MLGSLILYLKGMRTTMFQLSGFYYICVYCTMSVCSALFEAQKLFPTSQAGKASMLKRGSTKPCDLDTYELDWDDLGNLGFFMPCIS